MQLRNVFLVKIFVKRKLTNKKWTQR